MSVIEKIKQNHDIQCMLHSIMHLSFEKISLDEFLDRSLDTILSNTWFSFPIGCIFLVDTQNNALIMKAQHGMSKKRQSHCREVKFGNCDCGLAAESKKIIYSDNVDFHHDCEHHLAVPHYHYCVPIRSKDKTFGVLNIYARQVLNKNSDEETFLSLAADTLSVIIEKMLAENAKDDFIAHVSHELRTPLSSIIGYADTLNELTLTDNKKKEFLEIIINESLRLSRLIENVLDMSSLTSGKLTMNFEKNDIGEIIKNVVFVMKKHAMEKNISIRYTYTFVETLCDNDRINQVITNILSNAIKFSDKGTIIQIFVEDKTDYVNVSIVDESQGIPDVSINKVFNRFYQVPKNGPNLKGTGLGLYISRCIIDAHKGKIWAKNLHPGVLLSFIIPKMAV